LLSDLEERGDLLRDNEGQLVEAPSLSWERLPARVEAVIAERVGRLNEELRDVLAVASVEGEIFTAQAIARVQDVTDRTMLRMLSQELESRHGLVTEAGEVAVRWEVLSRYRFVHTLYQGYLYSSLSAGERRLLHGEIGGALDALHGGQAGEIAPRLAYHYDRAGRVEKAIEYALRAGESARLAYANEEAIGYYERALELLGLDGDPAWRLEALTGLGQVKFGLGKLDAAEAHLRAAIALGREIGLPARELVRIYHWLAEVLFWQALYDERIRIGEEGLALLKDEAAATGSVERGGSRDPAEALESVEAALMNHAIAGGYAWKGDGEGFKRFTYRTASFILNLPYSEELRPAFHFAGHAYLIDKKAEEAIRWFRAFEEKAQPHHDLRALMSVYNGIGSVLSTTGDVRGAISQYQKALELNAKTSEIFITLTVLNAIQWAFLWLGDLQRSGEYASMHLQTAQSAASKMHIALAYRCLGTIRLCLGAKEEAVDAFRRALESYQEFAGDDQVLALICLGRGFLAQGDRREALQHFQEAVSLMKTGSSLSPDNMPAWGQVFANALGGLEEAYEDPEALRAFCDQCQKELAAGAKPVSASWYLDPAESPEDFGSPISDFGFGAEDSENLESRIQIGEWGWEDPFGDGSFRVENGLELHAANARDLWHVNLSAPRLLRPAPQKGDWAIQTICGPAQDDRPAIGGLVLWKDKENYLRLDRGTRSTRGISFQGCLANQDVIVGRGRLELDGSGRAFLRLERTDYRVRALCSADGEQWFSVGHVGFPIEGPLQVGLHAIGMIDRTIYHGAYPDGTAIRFESFALLGLDD
jgi:tetratricopeptide (TPR) repeat protein